VARDDIALTGDVQARPVGMPEINFKVEFVLADVPRDPRQVRLNILNAATQAIQHFIDTAKSEVERVLGKPNPPPPPRMLGGVRDDGWRGTSEIVARYQRVLLKVFGCCSAEMKESLLHDESADPDGDPWAEVRHTLTEAASFSLTPDQFNDALRTVLEHVAGGAAGLREPAPEPPLTVEAPAGNLDPDRRAHAPYTPEQRASFDAFQRACGDGFLHPFTCDGGEEGRDSEAHRLYAATHGLPDNGALVAHPDGSCLYCPVCGYTQTWMHGMMADDSWRAVHAKWLEDFAGLFTRR